ncbi:MULTISPECIES: hypothetical protein [Halorussus]|uniref:hypothetical protein n=1 Tax=Halorussus TaxID=1070314 RepID=UPI000E219454|nr:MULTISPECIES: hypothetical protein [Halorussus]NHN60445.1 hypothetical protein [Halorussus sp. JP-T4]
MEHGENEVETDIWPLGGSRGTTIPPRILMWTQAPDAEDAEVRWLYDDNRRIYVEFGRASDERADDIYSRTTTIQKRSEGSRATTIPVDVLRGEGAADADKVVWRFDLDEKHPVRPEFVSDEEGDDL